MVNPVMPYAWGSMTFIRELLEAEDNNSAPQAELWIGAHPKASSQILNGDTLMDLHYIIAEDPNDFLGSSTAMTYNDQLPFLLKVLAAEKPLSIQVHPNKKQARDGFARENRLGIALDADKRNYKDAFHKPELLVALTEFHALCGFRDYQEMAHLLRKYLSHFNLDELSSFVHSPHYDTFKKMYKTLLQSDLNMRQELLTHYIRHVHSAIPADPQEQLINEWSVKLHEQYPGDIGVISPLLLNIVVLKPLEGLFIEAGVMHSYLHGAGIEIMANSDNVLRGGLTPKHVDTDELLSILDFTPSNVKPLKPEKASKVEKIYPAGAEEFVLSVIRHGKTECSEYSPSGSPEILFCYEGSFEVVNCSQILTLERGQSLFVPYEVEGFSLSGKGTIFRARCNV
jgi:mannose-6-phosphate isomerase